MKANGDPENLAGPLPFRPGLFLLNPDGTGYLTGNRCRRCGITFFPRREFCIACYESRGLEDLRLKSRGILHTFTTVYRGAPGYETPYTVGYIDLRKSGVRIFAPITGCRPEELRIGMPMELVFGKHNRIAEDADDRCRITYQFKPAEQVGRSEDTG